MQYKRILLKISGEALSGPQKFGVSYENCRDMALAIQEMRKLGLQVAVVVGGGNIFRGVNLKELGMERTPADHIGMLATMINGISLQQALQSVGCPARVMSAIEAPRVVEPYNWYRAQELLEIGETLVFVGGTGNPYFTTDTAAALRASEIQADALFKATKVDGIYNKDPLKYPNAVKYDQITYSQVLAEKLEVMDATAITLCRSSNVPILVFNMQLLTDHRIADVISSNLGTIVKESLI